MINKRVAVLAITAVAALPGITGCAGHNGVQTAAAPAVAPAGREVLDEIIDQVYGTGEQRDAGLVRQFYAWQAAMGECMRGKGADFGLPPAQAGTSTNIKVGPGELLAWSPQRENLYIADRAVAAAKTAVPDDNPALARLSGEQAEAWLKTQYSCESATKETEGLALPADTANVGRKFREELGKIERELAPGLEASWATCMTAEGIPAQEMSDLFGLASQKFPVVAADKPSDPTTLPGWSEAVAFERKAAASDWKCRGAEATRVVESSGARLDAWAEQNSAGLTVLSQGWQRMPAERDAAKAAAEKFANIK